MWVKFCMVSRVCPNNYVQLIFLAGAEVIGAMARGRVDDPAACIERDVVGKHTGHTRIEKRMANRAPSNSLPFQPPCTARTSTFNSSAKAFRRSRASSSGPAEFPRPHIRSPDGRPAPGWPGASRGGRPNKGA